MDKLPKYTFLEFLAAGDGEDFFNPTEPEKEWAQEVMDHILKRFPDLEKCSVCEMYCNSTEIGSLDWLRYELKDYEMYLTEPEKWLKEQWNCDSIEEFKNKQND